MHNYKESNRSGGVAQVVKHCFVRMSSNLSSTKKNKQTKKKARHLWLMPVIPPTQEAEIKRILDPAQASSTRDPISKNLSQQ
jgi:hypothetical protein